MKTLAQKLESRTTRIRRKLVDKSIKRNGEEIFALRLRVETDMYGDIQGELVVTLSDMVPIVLNLSDTPIPLSRYKTFDGNTNTSGMTPTVPFLFDILPITMQSKFFPENADDRIERGDLIVYRNFDEYGHALYLVFQVTEMLGVYNKSIMRYREYNLAVATTTSTEEQAIANVINSLPQDWDNISNGIS